MNSGKWKISIITSLLLGFLLFFVFWLTENLIWGLIGGVITTIISFLFLYISFSKSESSLNILKQQFGSKSIIYGDSASLIIDENEINGALLITNSDFVFLSNNKNDPLSIQLETAKIKYSMEGGFLIVYDEKYMYKFKVIYWKLPK